MKKILLVFVFALLAVAMLTITLFAEEAIEVRYYQNPMTGNEFYTNSLSPKEYATPNEDGSYTLRETAFNGSGTVSLSGKTVQKVFFGWYTEEGDIYAPGANVRFTKSTNLYQAWGVEVANESELISIAGSSNVIARLTKNIYTTQRISGLWGSTVIDLNGFNIDFKIDNNNSLVGAQGTGFIILGTGKITCLDQNSNGGIYYAQERWGDGQQRLWVGKNVIIDTANRPLTVWGNVNTPNLPDIKIYGTVRTPTLVKANGVSHFPHVNIFEGANITITGSTVFDCKSAMTDKGTLKIYGGTIALENEEAVFFTDATKSSFDISVSGGSFLITENQEQELNAYILNGYAAKKATIGEKTYTIVSVNNEGHAHNYKLESSIDANCYSPKTDIYTCECGETTIIKSGNPKSHEIEQTEDIPATPTQLGKKIYGCKNCDYSYEISYSYDPSNELVSVVIKGNKYDVKISEIFIIEATTEDDLSGYSLVGLKDYGEFTAQDISEINIPCGIMFANFSQDYASLIKISICDDANVVITSFSKLSALETIEIGAATVTFKTGCANNVIKNILSDVEGAYVTFEQKAFSKITSIEKLTFSTNSDYVLTTECFGNCTGIKEIIFPDYSRPKFEGSAFWENHAEYIYVGRGIYELTNDPFNRNYKLKTAVLMDVNKFPAEYTFCYSFDWATDNDPTTGPAEIYIHSKELSIANNAFYQSHGITVYTNAPITHNGAFSGCQSKTVDGVTYPAYTIVYGIPHKYVAGYQAPTCTENGANGYVTDCPCGQQFDGTAEAKIFVGQKTNSTSYEIVTYETTVIPATGHNDLGGIIDVKYESFLEKGTGTFICSACGTEHTKEASVNPIFTWLGYSSNINDYTQFAISYLVDHDMLEQYESLTGNKLVYGVVGAVTQNLGGKAPFDETLDEASKMVVSAELPRENDGVKLTEISFRILGFTEAHYELEMTMSGYITETTAEEVSTTVYFQAEQTENPASNSISKYVASLPPKGDEEEAA